MIYFYGVFMLDRFTKIFFNTVSLSVYVVMLAIILAIPGFLIFQGAKDPEFSVRSVNMEAVTSDDFLVSEGETQGGWYKITYECTASSGKYSPYTFKVGYFVLRGPLEYSRTVKHYVLLDEPLEFGGRNTDDFVLMLYVNTDEQTASAIRDNAGFATREISESFSMLRSDITFICPGFDVRDCMVTD